MFVVEAYAAVRRFVFLEGHSRREAARMFELSLDTVAKMCRYSAPPGYVRTNAPEKPKLEPLVPVIDAILEGDRSEPAKQQHTAKRIFKIAVARICGDGKRERTRAFTGLHSHYLFQDRFGRPGKGNDKGW